MVTPKLDDAAARAEILSGTATTTRRDLIALAGALNREGPPFEGGATVTWVVDVLEVAPRATWRGVLDRNVKENSDPFVALWRRFEEDGTGFRSFEPGDLPDDAEAPLRALASASTNHAVAARVFDVLWVRFKKHEDAGAAIERYLALQATLGGEEGWSTLVQIVGRLATLVVMRKDQSRLADVLSAFEDAGAKILGGRYNFGFGRLADTLLATTFSQKWARPSLEPHADRWVGTLLLLAATYEPDHHHGLDLLEVAAAWLGRLGRSAERERARRMMVEWLIAIARASPGGLSAMHLERATALASEFGIKDLVATCRQLMPESIRAATAEMRPITGTVTLPFELRNQLDELLAHAPTLPSAIRHLALLPGLLDLPVEQVEESAAASLKESTFLALVKSVQYRDGKISFQADTPEAKLRESVGRAAGFHLLLVELALRYFLQRSFDLFVESTIFESLAEWPLLGAKQASVLVVASQRFAARDWVSAGFIIATTFEAVIRSLMRASGYHALKGDGSGVLMDETLPSLLQQGAVRSALGKNFIWFAEHVFCRPDIGLNLRNEVAHGNIEAGDLTPPRVLLMWLFLVRVTCFVPAGGASAAASSSPFAAEGGSD